MFKANGGNEGSYIGLNTAISTAGGTGLKSTTSDYWTSTDYYFFPPRPIACSSVVVVSKTGPANFRPKRFWFVPSSHSNPFIHLQQKRPLAGPLIMYCAGKAITPRHVHTFPGGRDAFPGLCTSARG